MEHQEVEEIVVKWLRNQHLPPKLIGTKDFFPDVLVYTEQRFEGDRIVFHRFLQIECKKTIDDIDSTLGQCLRYYTLLKGLFTYLAIPDDFSRLKELLEILRFVHLPIGLLIVHQDGRVEPIMEAEGRETEFVVDLTKP